MKGRFRVDADQARLAIEGCRIGRVEVPGALVRLGSAGLLYALRNDPEIGPLIGAIQLLKIERGSVEVVVHEGPIDRHLGTLLARLGVRQDAAVPTERVYLKHLIESQAPSAGGDRRFHARPVRRRWGRSVQTRSPRHRATTREHDREEDG